jgi:hypothetical protein
MRAASMPVGVLLAICVAGCADNSPREFDRRMASYISAPEVDLVSTLGVPRQIYTTEEGRRFLEYDFSSWSRASPVSPSIGFGIGGGSWNGGSGVGTGIGLGLGTGGSPQYARCIVTFELRDNRVLDFSRQGEGCR